MPVVYFHSLLSSVPVINCFLFRPICQFESITINEVSHRSNCVSFKSQKSKCTRPKHFCRTFNQTLQPNTPTIWWTVTITSLLSPSLYTTVHFQRSVRSTSQGLSSSYCGLANRKKERVQNKHRCSIQFTQRSLIAVALLALVAFVYLCLLTCCKQTVWRKLALGLSSTCVAVKLGFWA